ncbi:MAG: DUF411 domain-containing protein [Gammaproteobacteria bacterium]|nr:DUF411 domain-containing protein [Gammaproteobacteria bacterium]MBU1482006.1 DUF411 domain-containing protein [Gammaproteobacteria bacterium]
MKTKEQSIPVRQRLMLLMLHTLALCIGIFIFAASATAQPSQTLPTVDIYKSPQCGCCTAWADHLRQSGFKVVLHDVNDVPAARKKLGMPERYGACHTARVGNYLVEGHVPAADIKRLLRKHPQAIGLAVPSMPPGSPGMESDQGIPYDTLLVSTDGSATVFAHHQPH